MAARGVNKVILVGNLGADPDTTYLQSGSAVCKVRVATSESWSDRQTGARQEKTEWHSVVFFGWLADVASKHLQKGSQVYIEGSLRTRKWQTKDGHDRYTTEIVASAMEIIDHRNSAPMNTSETPATDGSNHSNTTWDDDLPF